MNILVIEDDNAIRAFLIEILEEEGYQAVGYSDGYAALQYLKSNQQPQLIVLDLMMPRMNGWQFRQAQLADPAIAKIPVVVLSARADLVQQHNDLKANSYLPKPIDYDQLLSLVQRYCQAPIAPRSAHQTDQV